jgi:hypothetical protein
LDQETEFTDGEDLTKTEKYRNYRNELQLFLTCSDSMMYSETAVVPPNNSHMSYLEFDTAHDNTVEITVIIGSDKYIKFKNYNNGGDSVKFNFAAFDSKMSIIYMTERKSHEYFRLFGISLFSGNQFTVYDKVNKSMYERMFSWKFSPDFKYLLKTGDLEPNHPDNLYGWSMVNLTDGSEGKVRYKRHKEFISNPEWVDNETFKYTLLEMPFKKGELYDKDYRLYYALLNDEPLPDGFKMKYNKVVYPEVLTFTVKGQLISKNIYEYETGILQ